MGKDWRYLAFGAWFIYLSSSGVEPTGECYGLVFRDCLRMTMNNRERTRNTRVYKTIRIGYKILQVFACVLFHSTIYNIYWVVQSRYDFVNLPRRANQERLENILNMIAAKLMLLIGISLFKMSVNYILNLYIICYILFFFAFYPLIMSAKSRYYRCQDSLNYNKLLGITRY